MKRREERRIRGRVYGRGEIEVQRELEETREVRVMNWGRRWPESGGWRKKREVDDWGQREHGKKEIGEKRKQ